MTHDSASQFLRLHVLPAGHGDCFVIEYGADSKIHRVVVDGGTANNSHHLLSVLNTHAERALDLLVITHIDSDHISGILKLLADPAFRRFNDVWFNGYAHLLGDNNLQPFGSQQGEVLTKALLTSGVPWNAAFGRRAVALNEAGQPVTTTLPGGAVVTILSPNRGHLAALRPRWDAEVRAAGLVPTQAAPPPGVRASFQRMGPTSLDIRELAASRFQPDKSPSNASSIALLFEFGGRRILLGADAFADVLTASLRAIGSGRPVPVDVFKVPHHGSQGNLHEELLKAAPAKRYVISTNGDVHRHPDAVAIARVVATMDAPHLVFNYRSEMTKIWADLENATGPFSFTTQYGDGERGLVLDLL